MQLLKYKYILPAFFIAVGSVVHSQTSTTLTVNSPQVGNDHIARDKVVALPGSKFTPSSTNIAHLYLDKNIVAPIDVNGSPYSGFTVGDVYTIDKDLPVGVLKGGYNVGGGQLGYSIPIPVAPGTSGMAPNVSISYNSSQSNGIVGVGWNIGTSAISRVPGDVYHTTTYPASSFVAKASPIALTNLDLFSLDGNIIWGQAPGSTASNPIRRLENDNFTEIKPINNYSSFIVTTKEGMVMEYGNTTDSKLSIVNPTNASVTVPLVYYINKVTDKYGNYYTYKYYNNNGEVAIKEIQYTGNASAGIQPYNSVKFYYDSREDKNKQYFKGNELNTSLILREIELFCEGVSFKRFVPKYQLINNRSYLSSITEYGADRTHLNPTKFAYDDNEFDVISGTTYGTVTSGDLPLNADYNVGDFSGDGKADVVAYIYDDINAATGIRNYTGWNFYINQGDGTHYSLAESHTGGFIPYSFYGLINTFNPQPTGTTSGDFNGDGKQDLLLLQNLGINTLYTPYYSTGIGFTAGSAFSVPAGSSLLLADIDGNSVPEAIAFDVNSQNTKQLYIYNFITNKLQYTNNGVSTSLGTGLNLNIIQAINYDNDASQELLMEIASKVRVVRIEGYDPNAVNIAAPFTFNVLSDDYLVNAGGSQNHYGDFNGDGLTDQLHQGYNTTNTLFLRYATEKYNSGIGSFYAPSGGTFTNNSILTTDNKKSKTLVADMNNDGKADMIQMYNSASNSVQLSVSYGGDINTKILIGEVMGMQFPDIIDYGFWINETYPPTGNAYLPEFSLGDFDGDGFTDIMFKNNSTADRTIIYTRPLTTDGKLRRVTDGFGREVRFEYKTLAKGNIYTKGSGAAFPIADIQHPIRVISSVKEQDANGNPYHIDYTYEDAKMYMGGKGFLGFGKITEINQLLQTKSITEFDLNLQFAQRLPIGVKTYLLSDLTNPVSESSSIYGYVVSNNIGSLNLGHYVKLQTVDETDHLHGIITQKNYLYDNYHNTTFEETRTNNNFYVNQIGYTIDPNLYGNKYPGYVQSVQTISLRQSGNAVSRTTNYTYFPNGLLQKVNKNVGASCTMEMNYTYDANTGLPLSATAISSGNAPRSGVMEYDSKFRFVTKSTNAINDFTETQYDSRWGQPVKTTDITGLVTYAQYDGYGTNTSVTPPDNNTVYNITKWYDSNDDIGGDPFPASDVLITKQINVPNSPLNRTLYTARGLQVKIITETGLYKANRITYNGKGQVDVSKAFYYIPNANPSQVLTTNMTYDAYNRTTNATVTDGNTNVTSLFSYSQSGGNNTLLETDPDGKTKTTVVDPAGLVISVKDNNNKNLTYDYYSNGQKKEVFFDGNSLAAYTYDDCDNVYTENEPNYGLTTFSYDGFGQLKSRLNNNHTYNYDYDLLGRVTGFTGPEGAYTYQYITSGAGKEMLQQETGPNGNYKSYFYDNLNRMIKTTKSAGGAPYTTAVEYDQYSNPIKYTYPSGFALKTTYTAIGIPWQVRNNSTNAILWELNDIDEFGNFDKFTLGNGIQTIKTYNSFGLLTNEAAGSVFDHSYDFNLYNGDLNSLSDHIKNLKETYTYDNLDRLVSATVKDLATNTTLGIPITLNYEPNGNIHNKSDIGDYKYLVGAKPNAVASVQNSSNVISIIKQDITYTAFEKAENIVEGDETAVITYGPDQERVKVDFTNTATSVSSSRLYLDNYEVSNEAGMTRQIHYLNTPVGCIGMHVIENGVGTTYFTYADHLGTPKTITDAAGTIVAEQNFDAWGQRRNPNTWDYTSVPNPPAWLYRGYTGHEHLPKFSLINMNGRMYDPQNGRMLSVDPVLHDGGDGQAYNKYSYARNNPLKYTDPNGYDYVFNTKNAEIHYPTSSGSTGGNVDLSINKQFYDGKIDERDPGFSSIGNHGGLNAAYGSYEEKYNEQAEAFKIGELKNYSFSISTEEVLTHFTYTIVPSLETKVELKSTGAPFKWDKPKQITGGNLSSAWTLGESRSTTYNSGSHPTSFKGMPLYYWPGFLENDQAFTLPGIGIFIHPDDGYDYNLQAHELGHHIWATKYGYLNFYMHVVPASLSSAYDQGRVKGFIHADTWTEWQANILANKFVDRFNIIRFPLSPNKSRPLRLGMYPPLFLPQFKK